MAAGEPLNVAVWNTWREATGLTIREGYGQTETVILCSSIPDLEIKPGSMGLPPPGMEVAVIDKDGNRLPPGEQGEIAVRVEPEPTHRLVPQLLAITQMRQQAVTETSGT